MFEMVVCVFIIGNKKIGFRIIILSHGPELQKRGVSVNWFAYPTLTDLRVEDLVDSVHLCCMIIGYGNATRAYTRRLV